MASNKTRAKVDVDGYLERAPEDVRDLLPEGDWEDVEFASRHWYNFNSYKPLEGILVGYHERKNRDNQDANSFTVCTIKEQEGVEIKKDDEWVPDMVEAGTLVRIGAKAGLLPLKDLVNDKSKWVIWVIARGKKPHPEKAGQTQWDIVVKRRLATKSELAMLADVAA